MVDQLVDDCGRIFLLLLRRFSFPFFVLVRVTAMFCFFLLCGGIFANSVGDFTGWPGGCDRMWCSGGSTKGAAVKNLIGMGPASGVDDHFFFFVFHATRPAWEERKTMWKFVWTRRRRWEPLLSAALLLFFACFGRFLSLIVKYHRRLLTVVGSVPRRYAGRIKMRRNYDRW